MQSSQHVQCASCHTLSASQAQHHGGDHLSTQTPGALADHRSNTTANVHGWMLDSTWQARSVSAIISDRPVLARNPGIAPFPAGQVGAHAFQSTPASRYRDHLPSTAPPFPSSPYWSRLAISVFNPFALHRAVRAVDGASGRHRLTLTSVTRHPACHDVWRRFRADRLPVGLRLY